MALEDETTTGVIKAIVPPNIRTFSNYDTDLELQSGLEYILTPRQLRSTGIRGALLDGRVRLTEGMLQFPFKDCNVVIIGKPGGNTEIQMRTASTIWVKDFTTNRITKLATKYSLKKPTVSKIQKKAKPAAKKAKR